MNYEEAYKLASSSKVEDSYMIILMGNNIYLLLTYEEGTKLLSTLKNAEKFDSVYYPKRLESLDRDDIKVSILSRSEYLEYKTASLLGIDVDAYRKALKEKEESNE